MKNVRKVRHGLAAIVCAAALVTVMSTTAQAQKPFVPGILPPQSSPQGLTYAQWGDAWVNWTVLIPADQNPVGDQTGELVAVGQSGSAWFLAGNWGGTTVRDVTIPPGKMLIVPIVNYFWVNTPQFGDPAWDATQEAAARDFLAAKIDTAYNLSFSVDGRSIQDFAPYRVQTPPDGEFMVTLPEGNIWGIPADTYGPAVEDGYYVVLAPLSVGTHTLHITAALPSGDPAVEDWTLDVTYNITVAPPKAVSFSAE